MISKFRTAWLCLCVMSLTLNVTQAIMIAKGAMKARISLEATTERDPAPEREKHAELPLQPPIRTARMGKIPAPPSPSGIRIDAAPDDIAGGYSLGDRADMDRLIAAANQEAGRVMP